MTEPSPAEPAGALRDVRVLELGGIGPGPFCGMLLADMGADVVRAERAEWSGLGMADTPPEFDLTNRNKRSVAVDLKTPEGIETVLRLADAADILIDPFRPGVAERLGIGPAECHARNPKLVYGRMTGWGQDGPLAARVGHDLNYIALTGALASIGTAAAPSIPLNLVGDYGGGALYLAFGLLCALHEARRSGQGQVVDAAMTDGTASLMAIFYGMRQSGGWPGGRGENALDGGAPFYQVYATADGEYVSIAAIEPKFYRELLHWLDIDPATLPPQYERSQWAATRDRFAQIFRTRTRAEWCALLESRDVCFAPVLSLDEAPRHPHNLARGTFQAVEGVVQPGPAPRLSRTPGTLRRRAPTRGEHSTEVLREWAAPDGVAPNAGEVNDG